MWEVEKEDGRWLAAWNSAWLPDTYGSREKALEALLNWLAEQS